VDALVVSAGTYASFEWIVQPLAMPQACLRAYAARFSAVVAIPVVAVGRVTDPAFDRAAFPLLPQPQAPVAPG